MSMTGKPHEYWLSSHHSRTRADRFVACPLPPATWIADAPSMSSQRFRCPQMHALATTPTERRPSSRASIRQLREHDERVMRQRNGLSSSTRLRVPKRGRSMASMTCRIGVGDEARCRRRRSSACSNDRREASRRSTKVARPSSTPSHPMQPLATHPSQHDVTSRRRLPRSETSIDILRGGCDVRHPSSSPLAHRVPTDARPAVASDFRRRSHVNLSQCGIATPPIDALEECLGYCLHATIAARQNPGGAPPGGRLRAPMRYALVRTQTDVGDCSP